MWQLTELIKGLPGLLALCYLYVFLEESETQVFIFSLLKENLLFLKSRGFHFFKLFISDLFFQYVTLLGRSLIVCNY